ncbi:flagellar hook protein FlgE [Anaerocolumna jejuensis DSM 15929]|uniref:Flagellar hook protein FlgE n=1 Tax=Anaerocolumna jejuensis DSM 15929 TaxID=1121322 RepID=A0A1M6NFE0_9FIRM|nr:flagellar hook protein FlgE [Anaerocolumna jejuensis]SHJ94379.1 flagellar hook protein FlgE [Anaerocolumna jejuensis DSM 15929]
MMRSLYSGISGLSVNQTKMDVIGNNIANVNTVGFKASRAAFADVFYQNIQSASGPNESTGAAGQNAMQIGLGSKLASIVSSPTKTGGSQRTDNPFDLMISGDSFFIVNQGGTNYFSKAGDFKIDADGTLCTSSGGTVMGWQVDPKDPTRTVADMVSPLKLMSAQNLYSDPEATTKAYLAGNIDQKDTQLALNGSGKMATISFYDKLGQSYTATFKILHAGDSSTPPVAIDNQYSVQLVDVVDSQKNSILTTKVVDATGNVTYKASGIGSVKLGAETFDYDVNTTTGAITPKTTAKPNLLTFNAATGKFVGIGSTATATDKSISLQLGATAATNHFSDISIDFSSLTQFGGSGSTTAAGYIGGVDGTGKGRKAGSMEGLSVDTSGKIYGSYDNGDSRLLGQIAVASFSNPAGLEAKGGNLYAETQNSGKFDGIGHDVTSDGGKFMPGVLEMSNVDLASEFTEMITTQRGFQASSRIITTSDTLLEELINLKR